MTLRFSVSFAVLTALSCGNAFAQVNQDPAQNLCRPITAVEQVGVNVVHPLTQVSEGRAAFRFSIGRNAAEQGVVIDVIRPAQTYRGDSIGPDDGMPVGLTICREAGRNLQQVYPETLDGLSAAIPLFGQPAVALDDGQRFAFNQGPGTYVGIVDGGPETVALEVMIRPRQLGAAAGITERTWTAAEADGGRQSISDGPYPIPVNGAVIYRFRTTPDEQRNATFSLYGHEAEGLAAQREAGELVDPLPDPVLRLLERQSQDGLWIDIAGNDDAVGLPSRYDSRLVSALKPDTEYALVATSLNGTGTYSLGADLAPSVAFRPTTLSVGGSATVPLEVDPFGQPDVREHLFVLSNLQAGRYVLEVNSPDPVFLELGLENPFVGMARQGRFLSAKPLGSTQAGQRVAFDVARPGDYLLSMRDRENAFDPTPSELEYSANITITLRQSYPVAPRPQ